jgi:hypothetical protein
VLKPISGSGILRYGKPDYRPGSMIAAVPFGVAADPSHPSTRNVRSTQSIPMFWFNRKKFAGSYVRLMAESLA